MSATSVQGHKKQLNILKRLFLAERLPHALLFAGVGGIGKRLVAKELAQALLCDLNKNSSKSFPACNSCKSCLLFNTHNHPDCHEIQCMDRAQVNAESIRELLYSLSLSSFSGSSRVIIFDNAEFLSVQIANILLKTLEEPRKNTHFILVCSNPYRLPQTLLSRCQILHFNPLSKVEIDAALQSNPELAECSQTLKSMRISHDELTSLCHGSLENINSMISRITDWQDLQSNLQVIWNGDISRAVELADRVSKDKDNMRSNLRLLQGLCRNMMLHALTPADSEVLAASLTCLISAERLILDRNLSASYVLNFILVNMVNRSTEVSFTASDENVTMLSTI